MKVAGEIQCHTWDFLRRGFVVCRKSLYLETISDVNSSVSYEYI